MSKKAKPENLKLWDEILKATAYTMPEQFFPLFKEVYGKEYAKDTPVTLLSTEQSTYIENPDTPPTSRLTDITMLVNNEDYYHLECQLLNEKDMVIRMFAYDLHFSIQHATHHGDDEDGITLRFPRSVVIYLEKNGRLPDRLRCRIIFQDGSEHIYQVPTVRIQSYSLQEIREKHLNLFIPYVMLRFRPRLRQKSAKPKAGQKQKTSHSRSRQKRCLTRKELTDFVAEVILVLEKELEEGYLTRRQFDDYVNLFRYAAKRILIRHPTFYKEVDLMTKPLIELPSVREKRLLAKLADKDAQLADKNALLANMSEQLAQMKELLDKHGIVMMPQ